MPATNFEQKLKAKLKRNLALQLSSEEFRLYFDMQARELVKMSGEDALRRIRSGDTPDTLPWRSLSLMALLFTDSEE